MHERAQQGNAVAQFNLGVLYCYGQGVPQDYSEAVKWYRKAAEQNVAEAQFNLGVCYANGRGVPQDYGEAVKWCRKAAEQNNATAQFSLGVCYDNGQGVPQDNAEAVKWYRKAAEQGNANGEVNLGAMYDNGQGVPQDWAEAVKWYRKAAEQNNATAQRNLGFCYENGRGVPQDYGEAVKWYRKAAKQNNADAQCELGACYANGQGVPQDNAEAVKWYRKAAEQGNANGEVNLGGFYEYGRGVPQSFVESYKWLNLAAAQGFAPALSERNSIAARMTPEQLAEAQQLSLEFSPTQRASASADSRATPIATGTGFFITRNGYFISNYHVVKDAARVRLLTSAGTVDAQIVRTDAANDLALLKANGQFSALPVLTSRAVALGTTVFTIGFPDPGLQGFAPKLAKGEIASLSGAADDARYFQISLPVQPGNSGGALVDARGNVVGIVSAKLDALTALAASGSLPENVNYAVKSSYLLSFLESAPEVTTKLKQPFTVTRKFEDVVKDTQNATALVVVY